jgi:hypothetical protein
MKYTHITRKQKEEIFGTKKFRRNSCMPYVTPKLIASTF